MRKLYLIRHGQCRDGVHRCIGGADLPLDEVGLCQAERLRQWARSKPLTAVYTSPLSRCRETARILSDGRLPVHTADGLREMDGGVWEGLLYADIRVRWPEAYAARGAHLGAVPPPGGESFSAAGARLGSCIRGILARTEGDIALISHAGAGRGWLAPLLGLDLDDVLSIRQPWGGISELTWNRGRFTVDCLGLQPDPVPPPFLLEALLDRQEAPPAVRTHGEAVARTALALADPIPEPPVDRPLLEAACRLHDIAKGSPDHARRGARLLDEAGYPAVAALIAVHHDLPPSAGLEARLLYLADKLVQGSEPTCLEARFAASRKKCETPSARAAWERRYRAARDILDEYQLNWGQTQ